MAGLDGGKAATAALISGMATTATTTAGSVYQDPTCTVHSGAQPCRRRDGRILTSDWDGDCFAQASLEATRSGAVSGPGDLSQAA